jgi:hypothetical protein
MNLVDKILLESKDIDVKKIKFFYHATTKENFFKITSEGIKSHGGFVFLADTPGNAAKFLALRGLKTIFVCCINANYLDKSKLYESYDHSREFFQCRAYMYKGDIIESALEMEKARKFEL